MQLTPAQSQIAQDSHRFRVVDAGRRFGKSTLVSWEMTAIAVAYDNARVPYYAPTRDDARDIMWGMLKKVSEPIAIDVNESRLEITVRNRFGGTSLMVLYGWEAVQERGKGVGVKNNHIFLDEVAKYKNFWKAWQEILRPTLTDLAGGATFISTPNGFNHFYDLYCMELKDPDYKSFHFTSYDNPHLPQSEIDKAKLELTEDRFAQEYLADFRKTEGLVYKEFDRNKHLFTDMNLIINPKETIAGVDFGFTNPMAVLNIKVDFDNRFWIVSEYYETGKTTEELIEYLNVQPINKLYPDPENPEAISKLRKAKLPVRDVIKGPNSVQNGIDTITELFKTNKIMVHTSCLNFITEIETYAYPERKPNRNENENPIKENDHLMDALRMALTMYSPKKEVQHYRPQYVNPNQLPVAARVAKHYRPSHL